MKTSHILLVIITFLTLTGMVATNVLLKQQYEKIDWSDRYQDFDHRAVPSARHWVIEAAPVAEVIIEKNPAAQILLLPSMANSYRTRQQGDTVFVSFTMNYDGASRDPHESAGYELPAGFVLRLPELESVRITNGRLTVRNFATDQLTINAQNSRLRTDSLTITGPVDLSVSQNSLAILGADTYKSLRVVVRDSSGLQLNNTQTESLASEVSSKADVQLRGRALQWLK